MSDYSPKAIELLLTLDDKFKHEKDLQRKISELEEENDELRYRISELESELGICKQGTRTGE